MKRTFKIAALAALCLVLALTFIACGSSSPDSDSGACGSGVTWSYDSETQSLTVSGNGKIEDYEVSSDMPWYSMRDHIKIIKLSDGVEAVGDNAFYGLSVLESVSIPDSVVSIGDRSFAFCTAVENISLPSTLKSIGDSAFEGCSSLKAAFIPAEVEELGERAFAYCYSVTDAAALFEAKLPEGTFYNCRSLEKLLLNKNITEEMTEGALTGCPIDFEDASFTASKTASANVTVEYVYEDGSEAAKPALKENIEYGESYSIVSPAIEGYTADKLTVNGYVYGVDEVIKVTYTADAVVEETDDTAKEDEEEDKEIAPATIISIVVLAVVLVGIAVAAILLVRADKKNAAKNAPVRKTGNGGKNNSKGGKGRK